MLLSQRVSVAVKHSIQHLPAKPRLQRCRVPGALDREAGFTLLEVVVATAIMAVGFLGLFATVLHAGKLASAAEEEAMVASGLEQRIDQLQRIRTSFFQSSILIVPPCSSPPAGSPARPPR